MGLDLTHKNLSFVPSTTRPTIAGMNKILGGVFTNIRDPPIILGSFSELFTLVTMLLLSKSFKKSLLKIKDVGP